MTTYNGSDDCYYDMLASDAIDLPYQVYSPCYGVYVVEYVYPRFGHYGRDCRDIRSTIHWEVAAKLATHYNENYLAALAVEV